MRDLFRKVVGFISLLADGTAIAANIGGTLVVLALVAVVNFDVFARGVFNKPFMGAVEVVQFSMVLIVFMQLPDVVRVNRLTRSDGFLLLIGKRMPRLAAVISHVIDAVSAIFMALIAVAMWPEFTEMWHTKDYFGVPGIFTALWWPIKPAIFLSGTLCAIIFVLKILKPSQKLNKIRTPESEEME